MTPSVSSAIAPTIPNVLLDPSTSPAARVAAKLAGDLFGAAARELGSGAARALCSPFLPGGAPSPAKAARARLAGAGYAPGAAAAKKPSTAKASTTKKTTSMRTTLSTVKTPPGYAFLNDPKLSIEDKLMQLLAKLNEKYEAEMEDHLKRMAGGTGSTPSSSSSSSGSSSTKKSGGILGGIVSAVSSVVKSAIPAVGAVVDVLGDKTVQSILKSVGGPVLGAAATALGFPAVAPLIVKYAPQAVSLVGKVAKELDAPETPAKSASKTSSGGTAAGSATSEGDEKLELLQFQQVQEKQRSMFELASNVFKSMHDTRSAIIGNIR